MLVILYFQVFMRFVKNFKKERVPKFHLGGIFKKKEPVERR